MSYQYATDALLDMLDQAYNHRAWHGTNLRGSIRGMTARQAAWRPGRGRHNIWELVVHCAYWKYVVNRRLTRAPKGEFPLAGSNWFARRGADDAAWRSDVLLLDRMHRALRHTVASFPPARLSRHPEKSKFDNRATIIGAAAHDFYHTGQIQAIKKLLPAKFSR